MKISCVQMDVQFCAPDVNYKKAEELILAAAKENPDVIVLPEMWNTGFFPKESLTTLSDINGERTKKEIGSLAKSLGINIVAGSVANTRNGKVYNTSYVFDRSGNCVCEYDKTHLFSPMGEDEYFVKGEAVKCFELDGMKCGIIICYDLRFPELSRMLAVKGTGVLFVVSQWPDVRIPHLVTLLRARAIENQMFVACANSCGSSENTAYGGNSVVFDPLGTELSIAGNGEEIIYAQCDGQMFDTVRKSINVFCDRRTELYKIY